MRINKLIFLILSIQIFFCSCNDKAPSCSTLSWGDTAEEETGFDLKYSAGNQCENYNDYYDGDLNKIIKQIQSMRIVLNRHCYEMIEGGNDPEETEVECPEFVPETIEFGEMIKCSFGTPPDSMTDCKADPLKFYFKNSGYFELILWNFMRVENPVLKKGSQEIGERAFSSSNNENLMVGYFNDDNLTSAKIIFTWNEGTEEKTLEFSAAVETKE